MTSTKKTTEHIEEIVTQDEAVKEIVLDLSTARQLLTLYDSVKSGDEHFKNCQSEIFRQHLQGVYKARNVQTAYESLKSKIAALEPQNT